MRYRTSICRLFNAITRAPVDCEANAAEIAGPFTGWWVGDGGVESPPKLGRGSRLDHGWPSDLRDRRAQPSGLEIHWLIWRDYQKMARRTKVQTGTYMRLALLDLMLH